MYKYQRLIEKIFAVLSLFFYTGAIDPFISETHILYPIKLVLPNTCLVISLVLILARWKRVVNIITREKLLWVLLGIALVSPFWSDTPMLTLEKIMPLVRVTVFGVYLATCYSLHEQLQMFTWMFGAISFLSLLFAILLPSYGVMGRGFVANIEDVIHTGAWRGVFVHKNDLGNITSLSAVTFFLNATSNAKFRQLMWAGFIISTAVILGSKSQTALVVILIVMILTPFIKALRWNHTKALPFLIITILISGVTSLLLVNNAESILTSLGRDITFTGRTEIWPVVFNKIQERPWLGYGYETFWLGKWEGETADVWREIGGGFEPIHAHNGFLDLYLSLGLIGLIALVISLLSISLKALIWVRRVQGAEGLVPLLYLTCLVLMNLSESRFMIGTIHWLLYVTITISMHSTLNKLDIWNLASQGKVRIVYN
ncbi:O-antigen polymerase [Rivularia sp. IAM M-261]|nr:O-antigen polymerase [Calothrix sp. PCC 7716]GJD23845.1 O-antigen polymerase [Rivularia sp. IAM M-261]